MSAVASDDFIVFYQTGEQHVNLQLEHILTWTRNQHLPAAAVAHNLGTNRPTNVAGFIGSATTPGPW